MTKKFICCCYCCCGHFSLLDAKEKCNHHILETSYPEHHRWTLSCFQKRKKSRPAHASFRTGGVGCWGFVCGLSSRSTNYHTVAVGSAEVAFRLRFRLWLRPGLILNALLMRVAAADDDDAATDRTCFTNRIVFILSEEEKDAGYQPIIRSLSKFSVEAFNIITTNCFFFYYTFFKNVVLFFPLSMNRFKVLYLELLQKRMTKIKKRLAIHII